MTRIIFALAILLFGLTAVAAQQQIPPTAEDIASAKADIAAFKAAGAKALEFIVARPPPGISISPKVESENYRVYRELAQTIENKIGGGIVRAWTPNQPDSFVAVPGEGAVPRDNEKKEYRRIYLAHQRALAEIGRRIGAPP